MLHPDLARELAQQRQAQLLDAADRWRTAERVRVMPSSRAEDVQPVWRFTALVDRVRRLRWPTQEAADAPGRPA
jgi:hypothetical protein